MYLICYEFDMKIESFSNVLRTLSKQFFQSFTTLQLRGNLIYQLQYLTFQGITESL